MDEILVYTVIGCFALAALLLVIACALWVLFFVSLIFFTLIKTVLWLFGKRDLPPLIESDHDEFLSYRNRRAYRWAKRDGII